MTHYRYAWSWLLVHTSDRRSDSTTSTVSVDRRTPLATEVPRYPTATHRRSKLLPQPLLDHRFPRRQTEPHAVIERGVKPAGQHSAAPLDADDYELAESPQCIRLGRFELSYEHTLPPKYRADCENQTTSEDDLFRGRPPIRPLVRELLRFSREVAWPPRLAKIAAAMDREGSIAGRIAVRSRCTLI